MQHSPAAEIPPVMVHGRAAATRTSPEQAITDRSAATDLGQAAIGLIVAAQEVSAIDHVVATAAGKAAELLLDSRRLAAAMGLVVVDVASAARGVPTVDAILYRLVAA